MLVPVIIQKFFKNAFLLIAGLAIAMLGISASSQGDTNVRFNVYDTSGLQIPSFSINPPSINIGDDLIFAAEPLLYTNNAIAFQIDCQIEINAPDNTTVILSSETDQAGICDYDTSDTLANQNITLVSGQISSLNGASGNGSGVVRYTFQGTQYTTNIDTYTVVNPITLLVPPFDISPPQINPGNNLIFSSGTLNFSNNTMAIGVPCVFYLTPPSGNDVVLSGVTDSNGECQFNLSGDLQSQNLTLTSGNISDLNSNLGIGSGYITFSYNSEDYDTNTDTYEVIALPPGLIIPQFTINPPEITPDQDLTLVADPLIYDNNDTAIGIPCTLTITTPSNNQVVLESATDSNGVCGYTTASSTTDQGWTLISGDPVDIKQIGSGSGYIEYLYLGNTFTTNVDTYVVNALDPVLVTPTFEINPNEILIGESITFRLNPVLYDDGSIGVGLVCRLNLVAPDNTTIVFSGVTGSDGICEYSAPDRTSVTSWLSLPVSAQLAVDIGNPEVLNTIGGSGSGYAEVEDNGATVITNSDTYTVSTEDNEETDLGLPGLNGMPDFLVELVRTGGLLGVGVVILGLVMVLSVAQTIWSFIKK